MRPLIYLCAILVASGWAALACAEQAQGPAGLKDKNPAVRLKAVELLGKQGKAAADQVPALVQMFADPDPRVRTAAAKAVHEIGAGPKVVRPALIKLLESSDPAARHRAMMVIAERGKAAVPHLVAALDDDKATYWACVILGEIGPEAKDAVPALAKLLQAKNPEIRREAVLALASIGKPAAAAAPAIAKLLTSKVDGVVAAYALGQIGAAPDQAERVLRANVKSDDKILATISVWALARLNPSDKALTGEAVAMLAEGLKSKEEKVRIGSARALISLQADPEIVEPIMAKAFQGADESVVSEALQAYAAMGKAAVPRMTQALAHPKSRMFAAQVLADIGPDAAPATEALAKLVADKNTAMRHEALVTLSKIGPGAKQAVPALIAALGDKDEAIGCGAAYALGCIGKEAADAKPALAKALESEDSVLKAIAAWALIHIDPACDDCLEKVVAVLSTSLKAPESQLRVQAAETLGELGSKAKAAVPALKAAAKDSEPAARSAAEAALKAIGE
jgi:HEAT repeat protein